jgi:hypothetical protein
MFGKLLVDYLIFSPPLPTYLLRLTLSIFLILFLCELALILGFSLAYAFLGDYKWLFFGDLVFF